MRLIDADALTEELYDLKYTKECPSIILTPTGQEIYNSGVETAIGTVLSAPIVDAVPVVHARWVGGKYYNDVYGYEKTCTSCQKEYVVGFDYIYCPYCGAKMDGGVTDDNR